MVVDSESYRAVVDFWVHMASVLYCIYRSLYTLQYRRLYTITAYSSFQPPKQLYYPSECS